MAQSMLPVVSLNGGSELAHMIKPTGCVTIRVNLELFKKLCDPLCRDLLITVPMFHAESSKKTSFCCNSPLPIFGSV